MLHNLFNIFAISERVRSKLLCLFLWSLLPKHWSTSLDSNSRHINVTRSCNCKLFNLSVLNNPRIRIISWCSLNPLICLNKSLLCLSHMKLWGCFTWIIDDEVVNVIVVDYIRNVWTFSHSSALLRKAFCSCFTTLRFASLYETILLALRTKPRIIITLFCHRILSQLSLVWFNFIRVRFETFLFLLRIQLFWKISFISNNYFGFKISF